MQSAAILSPTYSPDGVGTASSTHPKSPSTRGQRHKGGSRGEKDSEGISDTTISKTMSYILRHGAEKEKLTMRPDGFVRVDELMERPKLKKLNCNLAKVQEVVAKDAKQRYQLVLEPSNPPPPQGVETTVASGEAAAPSEDIWWIRANQGHTLVLANLELKEINSASEIPMAVHGTTLQAWESIRKQGLSRMERNHIHMAKGVAGDKQVVSGMRNSSKVLVYINVAKAMEVGIHFYESANGVILSAGNEKGLIVPDLFDVVSGRFGREIKYWDGSGWRLEKVDVNGNPVP